MKRVVKTIWNFIVGDTHGNILVRLWRWRKILHYPQVKIDGGVEIRGRKEKRFARGVRIRKGVVIQDGKVSIAEGTNVGPYSMIFSGSGGVTIGKNVLIAPHVGIYGGNHNFKKKDVQIKSQGGESKGIVIEDDVWIGSHAVILDGVIIGKGSVIGAGTIVTKSTPPYSISIGNPAKIVGYRE